MSRNTTLGRRRMALGLALGAVTALGIAAIGRASDHQDTPATELQQFPDINDVYAFPGSSADRIVLAVTTASPVTPAQGASVGFDDNLLYQIKVDNTGDAVEDLVFQVRFEGRGPLQTAYLYGPVAPSSIGGTNKLVAAPATLSGPTNAPLGSAAGIQFQAGLFDDPFFLDLEQFFKIIPDRAPVQGPLSKIRTQQATSFRNPGFDYLRGFNTLGIVLELPESMILPSGAGADPKIGIWATTGR